MTINVNDNQDIVDIALQYYGTIEGLSMLIADNPELFEENWNGIPFNTVNIRPIQDIQGIEISDTKQMIQRLANVQAIATRYGTPPPMQLCGLINLSLFEQYPAQILPVTNEFLSIQVELRLPNTIITSIAGVDYTSSPTVFNATTNAGIVVLIDSSNTGQLITFEDFFAPTYLLPGLYRFEVDLTLNMSGGGTCTYHYVSFFNVW